MTRRGLLLFAAMCVIWGIPYLLIRVAVGELAPVTLVFVRTGVSALIMLPIVLARGGIAAIGRRWVAVLAFAAIEVGIPWLLIANAEQRIASSLAGLLVSGVPLVGVVIAPLFGSRSGIGRSGVIGLLIGLVGVAAIVGFDLKASDPLAIAEMGLVAVCYAVGPAILSKYLQGVPSVTVTGTALAACAIVYAPFGIAQAPHVMPGWNVIGSVAVLAVICTAIAFILFFALIAEVGPVRATVITYFNPAVAALAGVLLLHENFTVGMGVGFALVLAGSTLATRRTRTAPDSLAVQPSGEAA